MPHEIEPDFERREDTHASANPPMSAGENVLPTGMERFALPELTGTAWPTETPTLDVLDDMELDVQIDFGLAYMRLADVLRLEPGAVVPLDSAAHEPVDIRVGGQVIARGEILVLDRHYCVRVTSLTAG